MLDFINMNGYASYIWPAYGFALLVLLALLAHTLLKNRRLKKEEQSLSE